MTEKQGCGDEGETREAREGKLGKTRRWVSVGRRGDPGKIQGRSIDLGGSGKMGRSRGDPGKIHRSWGFGVQECQRKYREGDKEGRC